MAEWLPVPVTIEYPVVIVGAFVGEVEGLEVVGEVEGLDVEGEVDGLEVEGVLDGVLEGVFDGDFEGLEVEGETDGWETVGVADGEVVGVEVIPVENTRKPPSPGTASHVSNE